MKAILSFIVLLITNTCFSQTSDQQGKKLPFKFVELNHGVASPKPLVPAGGSDTSAWGRHIENPFKVIRTTDSVQAKLNEVFGVEFKVTGRDTPDVNYTTEWVYAAPMKEDDGRKYRSTKTSGQLTSNKPRSTYYVFNQPYQLLKGTWKVYIFIEKELMYTRSFIVY